MGNVHEEADRLLGLMTRVTGMDRAMLLSSRTYPRAFYRAMVAEELRTLGFSMVDIGKALGRDHSTMSHGCRRLREIKECDVGYYEVSQAYGKFRELVDSEGEPPPAPLDLMARDYVGAGCRRECSECRVGRDRCRYIQDEETFKAGARAMLATFETRVADLRREIASCMCLCGAREGVLDAITGLESTFE